MLPEKDTRYMLQQMQTMPATWTEHLERLIKEMGFWAEEAQLSKKDLKVLAEVLAERIIKKTGPNRLLSATGGLHYAISTFIEREDLPVSALEEVLVAWAGSFANSFYIISSPKSKNDSIWFAQERVLTAVFRVLGQRKCSLSTAGTVWRAVRRAAPADDDLAWLERDLLRNQNLTAPLAARFLRHGGLTAEKDWARREQMDRDSYPDIKELPAEMFLDVVAALPLPEEWFVDQTPLLNVPLVAPGLRPGV